MDLTLTADDDQDLWTLTKRIAEECKGVTKWERLGSLLLKLKQLDKAIELYNILLEHTSDLNEKVNYYIQLGYIKDKQDEYDKALSYYEKAYKNQEKILPANHPDLALCYSNIAGAYEKMGEYSKALLFHQKSLTIQEKTLPINHSLLAASYSNAGSAYVSMGEYSKALLFYQRTLSIFQNSLPSNHPDMKAVQNNIAFLERIM